RQARGTVVAVVVHLGHTRMRQARGTACLGAEPGASLRVATGIGPQQLDRDVPLQHKVHGPPHVAGGARGDQLIQAVPARQRLPPAPARSRHTAAAPGSHYALGGSGNRRVAATVYCLSPVSASMCWIEPPSSITASTSSLMTSGVCLVGFSLSGQVSPASAS